MMPLRLVSLVIVLIITACSTPGGNTASSTPTRVATDRGAGAPQPTEQPAVALAPGLVPTTRSAPTPQLPTPTASAQDQGTATPAAAREPTPSPGVSSHGGFAGDPAPSEETLEFAGRLQDAVFALEKLPGYRYTVRDPALAPGLTLEGTVASRRDREWRVHEQGQPDHVVGRWVLLGDKAYTDVSGRWEEIEEPPFETEAPVSFGESYFNQLFEGYGEASGSRQADVRVRSHAATRHDITLEFGDEFAHGPVPSDVPTKSETSMWIAKDGGYLLRFMGSGLLAPGSDRPRVVEVVPLSRAPRI